MIRPGIEARSPGLLMNTLPTRPMDGKHFKNSSTLLKLILCHVLFVGKCKHWKVWTEWFWTEWRRFFNHCCAIQDISLFTRTFSTYYYKISRSWHSTAPRGEVSVLKLRKNVNSPPSCHYSQGNTCLILTVVKDFDQYILSTNYCLVHTAQNTNQSGPLRVSGFRLTQYAILAGLLA